MAYTKECAACMECIDWCHFLDSNHCRKNWNSSREGACYIAIMILWVRYVYTLWWCIECLHVSLPGSRIDWSEDLLTGKGQRLSTHVTRFKIISPTCAKSSVSTYSSCRTEPYTAIVKWLLYSVYTTILWR